MAFYGIRFGGCASNCFQGHFQVDAADPWGFCFLALLACSISEAETSASNYPFGSFACLLSHWLIINTVAYYAYSDHSLVCQTSAP